MNMQVAIVQSRKLIFADAAAAVCRYHSCASGVPTRCQGIYWSCFQLWQVHHFPACRWCFTRVRACNGRFTSRLVLTAELKTKASSTCLSSCDELLCSACPLLELSLCCPLLQYALCPVSQSKLHGLFVTLAGLSVCLSVEAAYRLAVVGAYSCIS